MKIKGLTALILSLSNSCQTTNLEEPYVSNSRQMKITLPRNLDSVAHDKILLQIYINGKDTVVEDVVVISNNQKTNKTVMYHPDSRSIERIKVNGGRLMNIYDFFRDHNNLDLNQPADGWKESTVLVRTNKGSFFDKVQYSSVKD